MKLKLVPCSVRDASAFVAQHHRHHKQPRGAIFALAVARAGTVVGVATVGRPVARKLADGWTAEVTRVCVLDGERNACSMLYGTLPEEGGASLRGAGWRCVGEAGGGSWDREARPRVDRHPTQVKMRWEAA